MHLSIIHDSAGNVLGLAASPADAPVAYPATKAGQLLTIVDATQEMRNLKPEDVHTYLTNVIENLKIDTGSVHAKLVRK